MAATIDLTATRTPQARPWWTHLYVQVLGAILAGVLLGHYAPDFAVTLKPFGDGFIKLVKMIIAPVIFLTVATGIASIGGETKALGRVVDDRLRRRLAQWAIRVECHRLGGGRMCGLRPSDCGQRRKRPSLVRHEKLTDVKCCRERLLW